MAYDSALADRVAAIIGIRAGVTERKMFGGIAWMLHGNLACGVVGDELIVRLGPEDTERALAEPGVRPFDATGRPMRGFVLVHASAVAGDDALASWVDAGADHAASLPAK
jgi:TfoX/Sxy family transcriptional regulator of competence genes